ncbi:MAG: hypothetical protein ACPL1F_00990 [bacterium]|jgi:hypothetical protein
MYKYDELLKYFKTWGIPKILWWFFIKMYESLEEDMSESIKIAYLQTRWVQLQEIIFFYIFIFIVLIFVAILNKI